MKELLKDHPLDLFILIPSLPETSSLKKLDLASRYSSWFHDLNLRLQFFTDCTLDEQKAIAAFLMTVFRSLPFLKKKLLFSMNACRSNLFLAKNAAISSLL